MTFKIEYRKGPSDWSAIYRTGMVHVVTEINRLCAQGFEVRCLNLLGKDIASNQINPATGLDKRDDELPSMFCPY